MWTAGVASSIVFISLAIVWARRSDAGASARLCKIFGAILLAEIAATHFYVAFVRGTWSFQDSLPLHLCRLSAIIAAVSLLSRHQSIYEWTVYLGIPSGFHSIMTPELTQGRTPWLLFDYYFVHASLIAIPIVTTILNHWRPRKWGWLRMFLAVNCVAVFVFLVNFLVDANYMYLAKKPIAANPFLIGEWPWYIMGLEAAGVIHVLTMHGIFSAALGRQPD